MRYGALALRFPTAEWYATAHTPATTKAAITSHINHLPPAAEATQQHEHC
jgi:hypothetical protein